MYFFLILAALFLLGIAAALVWQKPFASVLAPVCLLIIAFGYALSLLGLLWLVPFLLDAVLLASACVIVWKSLKQRSAFSILGIAGLLAFFAMGIFLWWVCRGRILTFWDDFSHWGLSIKNMFYWNELYTSPQSTTWFNRYPPATQIFLYSMLRMLQVPFREDLVLFSQGLLTAVFLLPPLAKIKTKQIGYAVVCALFLLALPACVASGMYERLLVDGILGVLLFYVLWAHFSAEAGRICWPATLGCFAITLIKTSGVGLALIAFLLLAFDSYVTQRKVLRQLPRTAVLAPLAPLCAILVAYFSWDIHQTVAHVDRSVHAGTNAVTGTLALMTGSAPAYQYDVLQEFWAMMIATPADGGIIKFPSLVWVCIYLLLAFVIARLTQAENRPRFWAGALSANGLHVLFMASLAFSYLFSFSQGEALGLAAFFRYEATVIIAVLLYFFSAAVTAMTHRPIWQKCCCFAAAALVAVGCCCNTLVFAANTLHAPTAAAASQQERFWPQIGADLIAQLGEDMPRVFVVANDDYNAGLLRINYVLLPIRLEDPEHVTSVVTGNWYGPETSPTSTILSPEEWGKVLYDGYDYVLLYGLDARFVEYAPLFENPEDIKDMTMLRVVKNADGSVTLKKMFAYE